MNTFTLEKSHKLILLSLDVDNNVAMATNYILTYTLITEIENRNDTTDAQLDQNVSFAKINSFLENIINRSVLITDYTDTKVLSLFMNTFHNNVITLPELPEPVLISALHSKMNCISSSSTYIEEIRLHNVDEDITYRFYCDEDNPVYHELPDDSDWIGDMSYWDTPWWKRNDITTLDRNAETEEEYKNWLTNKESQNLEELNTSMFDEIEHHMRTFHSDTPDAEVVEVDFATAKQNWKPTLVD